MPMFYIPGAQPSEYVDSSEGFTLAGRSYWPGYLDRYSLDGATRCTYEPCPFDNTEYIITENRNGPVIGWTGTPRDPVEVARLKAEIAIAHAKDEISRLEALETKRRVAEAMPDEAGGTAEGRAWFAANRASIAALRAGL